MINKQQLKEIDKFVEKVFPIYCFMEWKWAGQNVTKSDIKNSLIDKLEQLLLDKDMVSLKSGGLFVERCFDGDYESIEYGFKLNNTL